MNTDVNKEPKPLEQREKLALVLIARFILDPANLSHVAPTHDQLVDLLNEQLPHKHVKRKKIRKIARAIVSKQQTSRFAVHLRAEGLMITAPGKVHNLYPTREGFSRAREWEREILRWADKERQAWAQIRKEAIPKFIDPSLSLAAWPSRKAT